MKLLFYVLQQKNGDVYLASGYYNTESENDLELVNSVIRWLFKLEAVGDIVEDNSEGEVRDMVEADSENEVENQVVNRPLNIANEPLLEGLEEKYVIFHNLDVVSGQSLWEDFLRKTESEEPADVKLAYYYTLREASSYGAEYYEQIKDDYPVVYIKNLVYDGDSYIISESNGGEDYSKSYKYLMKYTGKPSSPTALFSYYTRYVLVNKDTYTWEELEASVYSSQLGAYIDHGTVYTDYIYK